MLNVFDFCGAPQPKLPKSVYRFIPREWEEGYSLLFAEGRVAYCIYSIKHPGCLFYFGTLRVGAYSRVVAYNFFNIFSK